MDGTLDELAGAGLGADWGARMLSNDSTLYEPLSYNNGASWPFLTGWAALALYKGGRGPTRRGSTSTALADLTFLEARGYMPELFSGDRLRSVDAAVPHQLFATTGFVSTRDARAGRPRGRSTADCGSRRTCRRAGTFLRVKNLRWRDARGDLEIRRGADGSRVVPGRRRRARACRSISTADLPPGRLSCSVSGAVTCAPAGRADRRRVTPASP